MGEANDDSDPVGKPEEHRLLEMESVFLSARRLVGDLIAAVEAGEAEALRDLPASLSTLHKLYISVTEAEVRFNDKFGRSQDQDAIDFDAIRDQIGSRLDRLRDAGTTSDVSG